MQVFTSDFRHIDKCRRTEKKKDFVFIRTSPYYQNLSFKRLKSHVNLAKNIFKKLETQNIDMLWILIPPNSLVKLAANYKKTHKDVKLIFDIIDLWPETMPITKYKSLPPFQYWKSLRDRYLKAADEIVTECCLYQKALPNHIKKNKIHTIYLARKIRKFKSNLNLPNDKIALCYLGSINNIIDIAEITNIIKSIICYKKVEVHIIGDGENRLELIAACELAGANVIYYGKIYNFYEKQYIFDSCHFGLNIMKATVLIGLTMKSIDYFEAGLPMINNIRGDTWDILEREELGKNVGDESYLESILNYDVSIRKRVRIFFENNFDTKQFEKKVAEIIDNLKG